MSDSRYTTGTARQGDIAARAYDYEIYDRQADDPYTPLATCDSPEDAAAILAALRTLEAALQDAAPSLSAQLRAMEGEIAALTEERDAARRWARAWKRLAAEQWREVDHVAALRRESGADRTCPACRHEIDESPGVPFADLRFNSQGYTHMPCPHCAAPLVVREQWESVYVVKADNPTR